MVTQSGPLSGATLYPVTPTPASGPADASIVPVRVQAGALSALGYCVPWGKLSDLGAAEARVSVWRRSSHGAAVRVSGLRVTDPALAAVGEVYLAPSSGRTVLPDGQYLISVPAGTGGAPAWFSFAFSSTGVR